MSAQKIRFNNGATLWTCSMPDRDVSIDLWIPYGLAHQIPEAHFLEHMAFKSNRFRSAESIAYDSEGRGIIYSATTYEDMMNFHMLSPSQHVGTAIQILYESFANDKFVPEEVELEKGPIKGELLQRKSAHIYNMVRRKMMPTIFDGHPLAFGDETEECIEAVTAQHLAKAKQNFGPYSLCIGIAGDIDRDRITQLVNDTFGKLEKRGLEKTMFSMPKRKYYEELEERDDTETGYLVIALPVVGLDHPDSYSLDFISHVLGREGYLFSGRLFQEVRTKRGLAYGVDTAYGRHRGVGLFILASLGLKKKDVRPVRELVLEQLERLKQEDIGKEEFERVRTSLLVNEYRKHHSSIESISSWLGLAELYDIHWEFEHFELQTNLLTPQKIREVANKYFDGLYFIGEIIPKS